MKRKIYLASHGTLSHGLADSAKMICGDVLYPTETFALLPGMSPDQFTENLKDSIISEPETEHILLVDLFGASVCNSLYPLARFKNVFLFSGMNLNLLLSICVEYPEPLTESNIESIIHTAQQGIKFIKITKSEEETF